MRLQNTKTNKIVIAETPACFREIDQDGETVREIADEEAAALGLDSYELPISIRINPTMPARFAHFDLIR